MANMFTLLFSVFIRELSCRQNTLLPVSWAFLMSARQSSVADPEVHRREEEVKISKMGHFPHG